MSYGLFLAHILSALLSAWLAIRLVARHFPIREVLLAPLFSVTSRELLHYGLPIMPSNVTKFLVSELPVMTLNQLLPGAAGATASAYYSIARRLSSILQSVRMTFEYVIAPMASEKDDNGDRHLLQEMFAFATRLSFVFAILIFTTLVVARNDILAALRPDFIAASTTIVILCFGRVVEASTGPASAIIEMLAHRMLPVVNALIGLTAQIAISLWLIPQYGVTGAAIAAATGLNITAFLSALQSWRLFDIKPFSVEILRPMTIAVLLSGAFLTANEYLISLPPPFTLVIAIAFLIFSSIILVRFGFRADDAAALGPLGKLARPKARHRIKALKAAQKTGRNA